MKAHGGFIQVYSELGKGTKFKVYLPAETDPSGEPVAEVAVELPRGKGELILVVDDEDSVRQITKQTLEAFGYRVILANDGSEAVATYAQRGSEIDAIVTDMMMPVMDGPSAIRVIRSMNPARPHHRRQRPERERPRRPSRRPRRETFPPQTLHRRNAAEDAAGNPRRRESGVTAIPNGRQAFHAGEYSLSKFLIYRTRLAARARRFISRRQTASSDYMSAALPENETARLASLRRYAILDTAPEVAFDRINRIAAEVLHVPVSLVTLVDEDRQWFKAAYGFNLPETSRDVSFCAHAILSDEVMVVEDALADARFAKNPLVTGGPRIRFYAGAPIKSSDGFNIGTLCAIDTKPRTLTKSEAAILRDLAELVRDELELRAGHSPARTAVHGDQ